MKNLITALSVLTLGTTVGNLSSNLKTNQKTEAVNTILNQDIKKVSNVDLSNITAENNVWKYLTKNNVATYAGGENYYQYYFAYHVIGLNHDTLHKLNNAIGSGIGAVSAVLGVALPALAPIIGAVAAILIAQWYIWQISDYDNGNGVVIDMVGLTPTWIVNVSSQ
ncbi:MAG: hypothetical protein FCO83_02745 [Spiroplasma sp. WSS]|uniref:hypothetical protein n=1 Tax=Spiroplasma endosymbiont of Villa modesta TaxID=3066293 RepID=UPI001213534F|nr:MAG: hypothetical protein FCO83_02745 [Spiroplasma sp. WSS]